MTTQTNTQTPSLVVTMSKDNAKYATQEERAKVRNVIIAELQQAGVSTESISFRNISTMFPIVELADLLAVKLDGRENFKTGTVDSFQDYGTAIQSLAVKGFKKATSTPAVAKAVQATTQTSDNLLSQSVLEAIKERLASIEAYYMASYADLIANPAAYLADNVAKLPKIGNIKLTDYATPFDLPIERINALLQSEKYAAQLEQFKAELVCNKTTNFRVHETFLVCDGQPTEEQRTLLESKGYGLVAKDTTALQAEIAECMANQDFASVVAKSQELIVLQNTVEIRKALTE